MHNGQAVPHAGDICAVHLQRTGEWPLWFLATILHAASEQNGDVTIRKVRIIGEDFDRDEWTACLTIHQEDKQAAARRLAASHWVATGYDGKERLKDAILAN